MRVWLVLLSGCVAVALATKYVIDEEHPGEPEEAPAAGRPCRVFYQVTKWKYGRCQSSGPGVCIADDNRINIFSKDCGFLPDNK